MSGAEIRTGAGPDDEVELIAGDRDLGPGRRPQRRPCAAPGRGLRDDDLRAGVLTDADAAVDEILEARDAERRAAHVSALPPARP